MVRCRYRTKPPERARAAQREPSIAFFQKYALRHRIRNHGRFTGARRTRSSIDAEAGPRGFRARGEMRETPLFRTSSDRIRNIMLTFKGSGLGRESATQATASSVAIGAIPLPRPASRSELEHGGA